MLFFTAAVLLCADRDAQCKTRESPAAFSYVAVASFDLKVPIGFADAPRLQFSSLFQRDELLNTPWQHVEVQPWSTFVWTLVAIRCENALR